MIQMQMILFEKTFSLFLTTGQLMLILYTIYNLGDSHFSDLWLSWFSKDLAMLAGN